MTSLNAAQRERDRTETTVERTITILNEAGRKVSRGEAVDLFRRLEDLGCGQFIIGRRGAPSRFVWAVGIVSVGKAAAGESQIVEVIPETPNPNARNSYTYLPSTTRSPSYV